MSDESLDTKSSTVTWKIFIDELKERVIQFGQNPIMVFYLVFIVILIGSTGVWLPFIITDTSAVGFDFREPLSIGLATYCIAILSATMSDQLLSTDVKKKTIRFFSFVLFSISSTLCFVTIFSKSYGLGILTTLLSCLLWIITYSTDSSKKDINPLSPQGGKVENTPLTGTTAGFKN